MMFLTLRPDQTFVACMYDPEYKQISIATIQKGQSEIVVHTVGRNRTLKAGKSFQHSEIYSELTKTAYYLISRQKDNSSPLVIYSVNDSEVLVDQRANIVFCGMSLDSLLLPSD